jgi:amidase
VDAVRRELHQALTLCEELGHTVVEIPAPEIDGPSLSAAFFTVAGSAMLGFFDMMNAMLGRPILRGDVERFTFELVEHQRQAPPDSLDRARDVFQQARERYVEATRGVEIVVTPTLPVLPWELGTLSPVLGRETLISRTEERVNYTPIHNIVGCPAMSVPLGWSDTGLPVGIHFAAAPGADALLLALALELEAAKPWRDRWAPWSYVELV